MAAIAEASPLIRLEKRSGHTLPEKALFVQCELAENGTQINGLRQEGINEAGEWDRQIPIQRPVSTAEFQTLNTWMAEAANGPFQSFRNPCDVGKEIIEAEMPGQSKTILLKSLDCGRRIENQHPSALNLIAWLRQACNLASKKP